MKNLIVLIMLIAVCAINSFAQTKSLVDEILSDADVKKDSYLKDYSISLEKTNDSDSISYVESILLKKGYIYKFYVKKSDESSGILEFSIWDTKEFHYESIKIESNVNVYQTEFHCKKAGIYHIYFHQKTIGKSDVAVLMTLAGIMDAKDPLYGDTDQFIQLANESASDPNKEIFYEVDEIPKFNGNDDDEALNNFISENIRIPSDLRNIVELKVYVQFIINKEGYIQDAKVIRSEGNAAMNQEALRLIYSIPRWEPGKKNGKSVNVVKTVPIVFNTK